MNTSIASAQLAMGPGVGSTTNFATWTGTGFDPVPAPGHVSTLTWRPFGAGVPTTAFGGTCTAAICARGTTAAGSAVSGGGGFYAILPSTPYPTSTLLAMHATDTAISPGGVQLRLANVDASLAVARVQLDVMWAERVGIATSPDTLQFSADDCGASGITYPIHMGTDAIGVTIGSIRWQTHTTMLRIDASAAPIPAGGFACVAFTVGTIGGVRDVIALDRVTVSVPPSVCGDGFVDPSTEECEPNGMAGPCDCDTSCHFPTGACDDGDGNPCTDGVCRNGGCHATVITPSGYVPACDHDGNPCTFEGCVAGQCAQIGGCVPASACFGCDPTLLTCDVPLTGMTGCCTTDDDCSGTCVIGTCDSSSGTCTTQPDPACDDAGPDDGGVTPFDAGTDGGSGGDAGQTPADSGGSGIDGGAITIPPGVGFEGGGGCRCHAGGTNDARGLAWVVVAMLIARRRRRL